MRKNFTLVAILLAMSITYAQDNSNSSIKTIDVTLPNAKKIFVDLKNTENLISSAIISNKSSKLEVTIPNNKGKNERFILVERDLLNEKMKEQFPNIKSYYGYSTTDPTKKISLGYSTSQGINAIVYSPSDKFIIEKTEDKYELIDSENLPSLKNFNCGNIDQEGGSPAIGNNKISNPKTYRKYKLAVATDYRYNKYFSGTAEPTVEISVAAVAKSLTYILPIYENDLSISFQLADNLDKVTFLTAASSPFTTTNLNAETQRQLDTNIGSANYDIGILFTNLIGGGNAGAIGSVCNNSKKGSSYIGYIDTNIPDGFSFSVAGAHEMGHQFGANHVHARNEGYMANREIGSGVTVMGYPGVTGTHDVQKTFISQFNHFNLEQINNYLANQTCGTTTPSTNNPPIADAGKDYSIPKGTAFKLVGTATDTDNDNLTYSWEQSDPLTSFTGNNFKNPSSKNNDGANFRVYEHTTSPERYFPPIENVVNSQLYSTWNTVSDVAKNMNFVFQVRDNKQGGGQIESDKTILTVTEDGPFKINNIDLNQSFKSGETFDLKWDVAGTNAGAINTQNVKVKLTTDEGKTFTTLIESTPNNGQVSITLPSGVTAEKANIIVEAIDNIYYASTPFIAIGYEVNLSCNQYFANTPITMNDATGAAGITNITIPVSGETKTIEDISLITDITHANSKELVVMFAKSGVDTVYQYAWYQSCSTPDLAYKFNKFGGATFDNCGIKDASVTGLLDLKRYENKTANGSYLFRLADLGVGNVGTVNKIGVELCHRETSKLAVSDITKQNELAVYPNPTNGNFNIRMNTKTNKVTAEIINLAGQIVSSNTYNVSGNKIEQAINATNLPKGVYIVKINDGDTTQTKKLIIK